MNFCPILIVLIIVLIRYYFNFDSIEKEVETIFFFFCGYCVKLKEYWGGF